MHNSIDTKLFVFVGFLLFSGLILIVTKNEEWTFWLLKVLIENTIQSYHTKTMSGLITDIDVLRQLLETRVPDVCKHLDFCSLPTAVIATKWFICLFAEVLPIETVLRIWDCLFLEGHKVMSLHLSPIQASTKMIILINVLNSDADYLPCLLDADHIEPPGATGSRGHSRPGRSLSCAGKG